MRSSAVSNERIDLKCARERLRVRLRAECGGCAQSNSELLTERLLKMLESSSLTNHAREVTLTRHGAPHPSSHWADGLAVCEPGRRSGPRGAWPCGAWPYCTYCLLLPFWLIRARPTHSHWEACIMMARPRDAARVHVRLRLVLQAPYPSAESAGAPLLRVGH
jgi:hypothetical protein